MAITLPVSWQRADAAQEQQLNAAMDTLFPRVKDSLFQASLRNGKPVQLIIATDQDHPQRTLSLNAAPAPGASAQSFTNASDADLAKALGSLCQAVGQLLSQAGSRLVSCSQPNRLVVGDRATALTRYVRSGPTGFVSVWLVQYPDASVVYSLTLGGPQTDEAVIEPVFRDIWESLRFGTR